MLVAVLLLMAFTPLGYLNIGLLAITFNVIPSPSARSRSDLQVVSSQDPFSG